MPWRPTSPLDQKPPCIADDLRRTLSISEVGPLYGVRRQTGSQGLDRSLPSGPPGLEARSRTPCSSPPQPPQPIVEALLELRRHPPSWGAKQRLSLLQNRHPSWPLPARSTVWALFRRHGWGPKTRPRRHRGQPGKPTSLNLAPPAGWGADGKGHVNTGDGLSG